jgi:hypothetical protein
MRNSNGIFSLLITSILAMLLQKRKIRGEGRRKDNFKATLGLRNGFFRGKEEKDE